jgi:hypothetical protein
LHSSLAAVCRAGRLDDDFGEQVGKLPLAIDDKIVDVIRQNSPRTIAGVGAAVTVGSRLVAWGIGRVSGWLPAAASTAAIL